MASVASKKNEIQKVPAKRGRKPGPKNPVDAVVKDKPKRSYKKEVKKVNLMVRNITKEKDPIDTISKTKDKEKMLIKSKDLKSAVVTKPAKDKNIKKEAVLEKVKVEPRAKIIKEWTEKDKKFIMWTGVSVFMVLIAIFWVYSTKQSIENMQKEWEPSEKAMQWNEMADELSAQINEIKNGVKTVQNFASSSDQSTGERNELFQETTNSSTTPIDKEIIDDLKRDLEIKTGVLEPGANDYYYYMDNKEAEQLLASIDKIKIGADLNEVRSLLGEADFSQELKDQRGMFVSTILSYYTRIYKKDEANENYDKYVSLEFDRAGKLMRINRYLD